MEILNSADKIIIKFFRFFKIYVSEFKAVDINK